MLVRCWAAFLVFTTSVAAQPQTGRIAVGTAALSGRIVERDSRAPVADVVVTLASVSPSGSLVTQTDGEGRYVFEDVAPGDYRLTARHPEYAPEIYGMNLGMNPAVLEPILRLSARQRRTDVDFTLVREGGVAGRVTSAGGEAIRGVRMSALQILDGGIRIFGRGGVSVTNERGEYLLSNLPEGLYFIAVTWTDHAASLPSPTETQQIYFPGVDTTKDAATVHVGAGQTAANVDIVMRSTTRVRLTGHILRGPGEGTINAYLLSPGSSFHNVTVGSDGAFATPLVPPGRHTLVARAQTDGAHEAGALTVDLTSELTGIQVALAPTGTIGGRVVADDGSEVSDTLQVAAVLTEGEKEIDPLRRDRVDVGPGGRFEVKAMFGERVLRVINLDTGWSVGRILQGDTPVKSLTVQPGATISDVTIVVTRQ
jgi:Carboxypeptidase regulatory-like domain